MGLQSEVDSVHVIAGCDGKTAENVATALNSGLDKIHAMIELQRHWDVTQIYTDLGLLGKDQLLSLPKPFFQLRVKALARTVCVDLGDILADLVCHLL